MSVETAQVRWRADGTDPTTTEGQILTTADKLHLEGQDTVNKFRAIATSTTATLKVHFER